MVFFNKNKPFIPYVWLVILFVMWGLVAFAIYKIRVLDKAEPSPVANCDPYIDHMEEWIKAYSLQERMLVQCRADLIDAVDLLNADVMCSTKECEIR